MWVYLPGLNTGLAALKLGIGEGWAGIPIPGSVVFGEITGIVGDPGKYIHTYKQSTMQNIIWKIKFKKLSNSNDHNEFKIRHWGNKQQLPVFRERFVLLFNNYLCSEKGVFYYLTITCVQGKFCSTI